MSETLPIDAVLPKIAAALEQGVNAVLAAPPGAGKTTRVPLALIDAPWRQGRKILMLEPRRVAARAAADRLAQQLGEEPGRSVGYRMRGESRAGALIEVITEGVLTRMIQSDPELPDTAAILFDEAHERSVQSDLGLALALDIQSALRPDLRLLIMSATLDTDRYAHLLDGAPVITSAGRIHPVQTHWLDRPWQSPTAPRDAFERRAARLIEQAADQTEGDILAFLPGAAEIDRTGRLLDLPDLQIQTLHGRMPFRDQRRILQPNTGVRRVILATAIAETSLTVPGVRVVVDAGRARRAVVDPATGLSRLQTGLVSRAQAEQRRGRAGRLGPGTCFRMWTRGQEGGLPAFAPPEILECDLSALALELANWGVATPEDMKFLDQPSRIGYAAAQDLLRMLGALDDHNRITPHGRQMARKGMPPRLAHMLLLARAEGSEAAAAVLAAMLQDRVPQTDSPNLIAQIEAVLDTGRMHPALVRIRKEARRIAGSLPRPAEAEQAMPRLAAWAYPDRIASRRPDQAARFLMSNGRGAVIAGEDRFGDARYLVATDVEDGREARIRTAVRLSESDLRAAVPKLVAVETRVAWNQRTRRVDAETRQTLGAIVLSSRPMPDPPEADVLREMITGLRQIGVPALSWPDRTRILRARVAWLHAQADRGDLPDLSDQALADSFEDWLGPYLAGVSRPGQIKPDDLHAAILGRLDWTQRQIVEKEAPERWKTPLGRDLSIDWDAQAPSVAVRVQEVFGLSTHPCVGRPARPLVMHLLSPAGRPVQTTSDLPGFWKTSYADVRKDMRARYPKHPWPEDPISADPTTRTKRHRAGTEK